jgi:SOS regulatory protein LexA
MHSSKYFNKIFSFYYSKKRMPSYSEIMEITGLKSKNAVYKLVSKMTALRLIEKDATGRILPGSFINSLRILGRIEAGFPSPAEEELTDTVSLDEYLIDNKDATYMLKVDGDSMIDAGIMPGDMVLVERGKEPKDGSIVIAQVDNQWTMKYLRKKGKKVYLEAANKKYKPIYPTDELHIAAVVKAVIRKY